jgi:predicted DNA-binding transcriptional regulator AlpA
MDESDEEVYLTQPEVMKLLDVSRQTLLRLRNEGKLDTYYKGGVKGAGRLRFSASNVEAFLTQNTKMIKQPIVTTGEQA